MAKRARATPAFVIWGVFAAVMGYRLIVIGGTASSRGDARVSSSISCSALPAFSRFGVPIRPPISVLWSPFSSLKARPRSACVTGYGSVLLCPRSLLSAPCSLLCSLLWSQLLSFQFFSIFICPPSSALRPLISVLRPLLPRAVRRGRRTGRARARALPGLTKRHPAFALIQRAQESVFPWVAASASQGLAAGDLPR